MKFLFFIFFTSFAYGQNTLTDCVTKLQADKSMTLDCILAEISLHEVVTESNKKWLGIGRYVADMRFYIKNPATFSDIEIKKPIIGAVEQCSVKNLFNYSNALLVMQSPSPQPGGNYLKKTMIECLRTILSDEFLNRLFKDMEFRVTKKSFTKRIPLN